MGPNRRTTSPVCGLLLPGPTNAVSSRSAASLQRILVAHASDIEAVVRRYVDDEMDRDDLRQEIAIAVWRALPRFLGQSSERTYVLRIAQNRAVSFRLRLARNRALFNALGDDDVAIASHSGEYDLQRAYAQVVDAMTKLPSSQHDVLSLAAAGYSPRQIASHTGRSAGAIRVALHRAREALRRLVGHTDARANEGSSHD
jgi:RNA polymerase sigma-70 factor, ECF subfamily